MITIYAAKDCIWCLKAKQIAEMLGLEHEYKPVEFYMAEFRSKFPNETAVPQIMWDERHLNGYDMFAEAINSYIEMMEKKDD